MTAGVTIAPLRVTRAVAARVARPPPQTVGVDGCGGRGGQQGCRHSGRRW